MSDAPPPPPPQRSADGATSDRAIAALVFGILSFFIPLVASAFGLGFGIAALKQIKAADGRLRGKNMAIAGIVMSVVTGVIFPLSIALLFWACAVAARTSGTCFA